MGKGGNFPAQILFLNFVFQFDWKNWNESEVFPISSEFSSLLEKERKSHGKILENDGK